ncbi:YaaL family protein [Lachnoclostridium sp.]|uniref:YaaL family protein n=1 Tax=Lachnoclostridium sp. TaxID=2028282 RepID=UPI002897220B|nr:YaaL family protein [Lachnoclostridium sp.]
MHLFKKKQDEINKELLKEIANTQKELESAYSNFENVVDPDLIDSCIYQVNAIQQRYKFLLKQVKKSTPYSV